MPQYNLIVTETQYAAEEVMREIELWDCLLAVVLCSGAPSTDGQNLPIMVVPEDGYLPVTSHLLAQALLWRFVRPAEFEGGSACPGHLSVSSENLEASC